ncbi:type II toxin-antitoxin system PemK/MazF family toxin [Micromonospora sp. NPDC126480]|uniref:type II toxin-antitoxin system PemK/MazF family toxin n=1 Tax=Micromonospora sp. NPDC126480 TaxID=3155312 RepID=UPI00331C40AD
MPDWLLWAVAIVLAVAAGWSWNEWRHRASGRRSAGRVGGRPEAPGGSREGRADRGAREKRAERVQEKRGAPGTRGAGHPGGRGAGTRTRSGRARATTAPRPRPAGEVPTPRPGEIWWADVPYADGTGSKVRPCLVLHVDARGADVLKITSRDKSDRDDHVRIPTRDWDPDADQDSFLNLAEPARIPFAAFADHAGTCDPALWRRLRRLPH